MTWLLLTDAYVGDGGPVDGASLITLVIVVLVGFALSR